MLAFFRFTSCLKCVLAQHCWLLSTWHRSFAVLSEYECIIRSQYRTAKRTLFYLSNSFHVCILSSSSSSFRSLDRWFILILLANRFFTSTPKYYGRMPEIGFAFAAVKALSKQNTLTSNEKRDNWKIDRGGGRERTEERTHTKICTTNICLCSNDNQMILRFLPPSFACFVAFACTEKEMQQNGVLFNSAKLAKCVRACVRAVNKHLLLLEYRMREARSPHTTQHSQPAAQYDIQYAHCCLRACVVVVEMYIA